MINHFDEAKAVYAREDSPRSLLQEMDILMAHPNGYVLSTPHLLCLARTVIWPMPPEVIIDPEFEFPTQHVNCWHIHCLAGSINSLFTFMPFRLPYVSWERRNELRVYPLTRIIGLSCNTDTAAHSTNSTPTTKVEVEVEQPPCRPPSAPRRQSPPATSPSSRQAGTSTSRTPAGKGAELPYSPERPVAIPAKLFCNS